MSTKYIVIDYWNSQGFYQDIVIISVLNYIAQMMFMRKSFWNKVEHLLTFSGFAFYY